MDRVPHVHLPPGYRVEWVEGNLSLFAPRERLVDTYPATTGVLLTVEEHAWQDAIRQLHSDTTREIREFRAGIRSVEGLHRMRQYVGLLEALAEALPDALSDKPVQKPVPLFRRRRSRARGLVVAGGLAVAAMLALVIFPAETPAPRPATVIAPTTVPRTIPTQVPRQQPVAQRKIAPSQSRPTPATRIVQVQRQAKTVTGYVATFGRFTSLQAAQVRAKRVRAKGYLATVIRAGESFHVRSRIYATRTQAERWAGIFQEIGLPASVDRAGL